MGERHLWFRPGFSSIVLHILFVLLDWLKRWEVSGRKAVVLLYTHIHADVSRNIMTMFNDERTHFFIKIYLLHFILERVAKGLCSLCVRGELETGTDCYILTPSSSDHSSTEFNHVHRSRWYFDIFDQMHLFLLFLCLFTQVHLLIDGSVEGQYVTVSWGVALWIYSILLVAFFCSSCLTFLYTFCQHLWGASVQ